MVTFPVTLSHGKGFDYYCSPNKLARAMKKAGLSSRVTIAAQVSDNLHRRHQSEWLEFDVEHKYEEEEKAPLWGLG
jgi:hypothetical protein